MKHQSDTSSAIKPAALENIDACPICGGEIFKPLFQSEDHYSGRMFELTECITCKFVITSPRPPLDRLGDYYPPEYYGSKGRRFHPALERIVQWFRERIADSLCSRYPAPGRVLEVGSGRGTLLAELAKRGWQAFGTEFSSTMAEASTNSFGVTVYPTPDLRDCRFESGSFDVVICYHVLEHMPNPLETLKEMRRIISPNGLLLLAVPNFGGIVAQLSKGMWFAVDAPRHLGHYAPETMKNALDAAGFVVTKKRTLSLEQDVFGFAQSMMNLLGFPFNAFYDLIRHGEAKLRHESQRGASAFLKKAGVFIAGGLLSCIGLPAAVFFAAIGAGGSLEVWAVPERNYK